MRRRSVLQGLAGSTALLALGGCQTGFRRRLRFRKTVEVMTPQGMKSGSAVYEVSAAPYYDMTLPNNVSTCDMKGEALVVDLPDGPLFALLDNSPTMGCFEMAAITALNGSRPTDTRDVISVLGRLSWESRKADVSRTGFLGCYPATCNNWPRMVRFTDVQDPSSVEAVDPETIGVKRIWVETTGAPVTRGIEKRLGWLPSLHGEYINGFATGQTAGLGLSKADFSTEIN